MKIPSTLAAMLATGLVTAPAQASGVETHSGILTAIDPARHTVTLSEMGPWTGPMTARTTRTIAVSPGTRIELVQRAPKPSGGGWPGGYGESPLAAAQLRPGEFATIQVTGRGHPAIALSIEVVGPTSR